MTARTRISPNERNSPESLARLVREIRSDGPERLGIVVFTNRPLAVPVMHVPGLPYEVTVITDPDIFLSIRGMFPLVPGMPMSEFRGDIGRTIQSGFTDGVPAERSEIRPDANARFWMYTTDDLTQRWAVLESRDLMTHAVRTGDVSLITAQYDKVSGTVISSALSAGASHMIDNHTKEVGPVIAAIYDAIGRIADPRKLLDFVDFTTRTEFQGIGVRSGSSVLAVQDHIVPRVGLEGTYVWTAKVPWEANEHGIMAPANPGERTFLNAGYKVVFMAVGPEWSASGFSIEQPDQQRIHMIKTSDPEKQKLIVPALEVPDLYKQLAR